MNQLSGPVLRGSARATPRASPTTRARRCSPCSRSGSAATAPSTCCAACDEAASSPTPPRPPSCPRSSRSARCAAKLVLGGWPLAGDDEDEDAPPKEGSALARIVSWLREGYPGGVPEHDYLPLLALLERRLTRSEVKKVAKALRRADVSPAGPSRHRGRHHRVHAHRAERQRPAPGARPARQEGLAGRVPRPRPGLSDLAPRRRRMPGAHLAHPASVRVGAGPGHSNARPASLTDGRHWLVGPALRAPGRGDGPSGRAAGWRAAGAGA